MLPMFFQVVLQDSSAKAGARLIVPSLATPIGGVIAGYTMSKYGKLAWLVRWGTLLMTIGNLLVTCLGFTDSSWKYLVFLIPANLGLGMTNPSLLFSFISAFEHRGKQSRETPSSNSDRRQSKLLQLPWFTLSALSVISTV
jgi:Na+/melibiose symporter-like transporter